LALPNDIYILTPSEVEITKNGWVEHAELYNITPSPSSALRLDLVAGSRCQQAGPLSRFIAYSFYMTAPLLREGTRGLEWVKELCVHAPHLRLILNLSATTAIHLHTRHTTCTLTWMQPPFFAKKCMTGAIPYHSQRQSPYTSAPPVTDGASSIDSTSGPAMSATVLRILLAQTDRVQCPDQRFGASHDKLNFCLYHGPHCVRPIRPFRCLRAHAARTCRRSCEDGKCHMQFQLRLGTSSLYVLALWH
jgi:hypothetical protein